VAVNVIMLALGFGLSRLAGASLRQSATVAIESSVQNTTLAIVIAATMLQNDPMAMPAAIYSAFMYLTGIAFVFVMRRYLPPLTVAEEAAAQDAI
jgi:BASS family bile acid:Na+ symporter